jgi:hypothetical protein
MRENDEFIGQVEDYLVEFDGATPLPGRVQDAIHAELPRTRQAKAGPGFMRMPPMLSTISSRAPLGVAAAAVVVAVALGVVFINRNDDQSGAAGVPAASPTPVESPAASAALIELPNANQVSCPGITGAPLCIEPGRYQLGDSEIWPAVVSFDVPENWWYFDNGNGSAGLLVQTDDVQNGSGWGIIFNTIGEVSRDPCDRSAGRFAPDEVDTASEFAAAVAAWPGFETTDPVAISDLGYPGVEITVTSAPQNEDCVGSEMFKTASSASIDTYPMVNAQNRSHATQFRIFETEQGLLLVAAMNFPEPSPHEENNGIPFDPERHVDHQVEMDAILDSIRIEAPQP